MDQMTEERKKGEYILSNTQIVQVIEKIQGRVKAIYEDKELSEYPRIGTVLETIDAMLNLINNYAQWVSELKKELNICADRNRQQAEVIKNLKVIQT